MRITAHWSILKPQNIIKRVHWVMDIERPFQTEEHTNMMKLKDRVEHEGIDLAKMLRKKKHVYETLNASFLGSPNHNIEIIQKSNLVIPTKLLNTINDHQQ